MKNSIFLQLVKAEYRCCLHAPVGYLFPVCFFIVVVLVFPIVQASAGRMSSIEVSTIIMIAAALSILLFAQQLFSLDYEYGIVDHWLLSSISMHTRVCARLYVHTIVMLLFMLVGLLSIAPMLSISIHLLIGLMLSLCLVVPLLVMLVACISAICITLKRAGLLLAILTLPLYIPILIYGCAIPVNFDSQLSIGVPAALLGAGVLLSLALGPFFIGALLRIGIVYS